VAYGASPRAYKVVPLKISDIDSKRTIICVEQGKGGKNRNVTLSPSLLDLLRAWWQAALSRRAGCSRPPLRLHHHHRRRPAGGGWHP
jgi:integrase